jgi:hypothetical protein
MLNIISNSIRINQLPVSITRDSMGQRYALQLNVMKNKKNVHNSQSPRLEKNKHRFRIPGTLEFFDVCVT